MTIPDHWQGRPGSQPPAGPVPGHATGRFWLLSGGRVVTPHGVLSPGWITVAGDRIDAVGPGDGADQRAPGAAVVDLRDHWVLPGFVDPV